MLKNAYEETTIKRVSKAVRAKQLKVLGKLDPEDLTPFLRKIEKSYNLDFANMKPRTRYFEGQTFISPEFKQQGKPYQINAEIRQKWLIHCQNIRL